MSNLKPEVSSLEDAANLRGKSATIRWSPAEKPGATSEATLHFRDEVSLADILSCDRFLVGPFYSGKDVNLAQLFLPQRTTSVEIDGVQYCPGGTLDNTENNRRILPTVAGARPIPVDALNHLNFALCPDFPARAKLAQAA